MSEKRRTANKQNALKSTGPKSAEGKARAKLNALKHGAYALVCCVDEDIGRFKHLMLDLLAEFQPDGFQEKLVITEIAHTIWRKNRFKVAETQLMDAYSYANFGGGRDDEKTDAGTAMAQDAAAYGTIPSCLAAENLLDQRLWKLFDRLKKLQKKRGKKLAALPAVIDQGVDRQPLAIAAPLSGQH